MSNSRFVYVTYIRTSIEKVWDAIRLPEFTKKYWMGFYQVSDWTKGAEWKLMFPDGRLGDIGEILEIDPPRRLVIRWRNEFRPELKAEGDSRLIYELETQGEMVKLTVVHEMDKPESILISKVSNGWPAILSSMKSLLETGAPLPFPAA